MASHKIQVPQEQHDKPIRPGALSVGGPLDAVTSSPRRLPATLPRAAATADNFCFAHCFSVAFRGGH